MPVPEPTEVPAELLAAKEAVQDQLLALPGVTGVAVGLEEVGGEPTGRLAIRVFVESKFDVPDEQAIPTEVFGFPTDVVEGQRFVESQLPDQERYDPLEGGISGGPCKAHAVIGPNGSLGIGHATGTLGGFARDTATGKLMMVSNAHVLDPEGHIHAGTGSDVAVQPEHPKGHCPTDADPVGDTIGPILRASLADAAAAHMVDAAALELNGVRSAHHAHIVEVGTMRGTAVPVPGLPVRKRGKTTGLTFGHIFDVGYTGTNDSGNRLTDQFRVVVDPVHSTVWSGRGDSGSFVVTADDRVVGLHWGHDPGAPVGVASPIHNVERVLSIQAAFAPVVTGMTPQATWVGPLVSTVTLTGRGFQGGNLLPALTQVQVLFGGQLATIVSATDDQLVVTPPPQLFPTTVDVVVRFGWESSDLVQFTYESVPVIASVSPAQGGSGGGDTVSIFGAGLSGLHRVSFGDNDAEVLSVTDTQIDVVSPPASGFAGAADVAVHKASGRSAPWFGAQFTYL